MIVGIDEVGRGPWAGPLVFGAVVLGGAEIDGLTDSKKLSKRKRESLSLEIYDKSLAVGLGWVTAAELDELGMSNALTEACKRALEQVRVPYEQIILDGTINFLKNTGKGPYVTTLAKADLLVPSVSAASIVAKVARDTYMAEQDSVYPGYGFSAHAGYGTAAHKRALETLGVTPLHRQSFAPIKALRGQERTVTVKAEAPPRNTGAVAEDAAEDFLMHRGFKILERNWRTKICEVDIIAQKDDTVYFVEVKYRRTHSQGGGVAAITSDKLHHMERAVRAWMQRYGERNAHLSFIEVSGNDYRITQFLEQV